MALPADKSKNNSYLHVVSPQRRLTGAEILDRLCRELLGTGRSPAGLPFCKDDVTCGCENELQAVVIGSRKDVDLPQTIEQSNYFQNIIRRHRQGETPRRVINELEDWLASNHKGVWENSWVRLPLHRLTRLSLKTLQRDLAADKKNRAAGRRRDAGSFFLYSAGRTYLRIPVSYLLKLALVDVAGRQKDLAPWLRDKVLDLAEHFLCDNSSPETYSFHLSTFSSRRSLGAHVAAETARRFLLVQLVNLYAERFLGLQDAGQRVSAYFAPHPPWRQKRLSECITDAFYRDLFMNPCLSGWDQGEDKHRYMHLCHQVLSRAQLNAMGRLKEAGIITNNLVVMPNASNISLANNGTHVSLGSRILTQAFSDPSLGFGPRQEKLLGDLTIKIVEHFLPLFVGTYSAAPFRLGFADFQPERLLNFLPYQLDYTHLRMIWRRWRKKARLKIRPLGLPLSPFGPPWLDRLLSRLLRLPGDMVPDFRLLDYLVALMSTYKSPALNGRIGNQDRLKQDLASLGVFDPRMPVYLPYRQRSLAQAGYSGFEGRYYSLFSSLERDLGEGVDLQCLVTALAYKLIASGVWTHMHIPDDPEVESERRQIFFGAAIGLPTFYVRIDTGNLFLRMLVERTQGVRHSRRYPGYFRVPQTQFRIALARFLELEGADLIECMGLEAEMNQLRARLQNPEQNSAASLITRAVLSRIGCRKLLQAEAETFNQGAEEYYREGLRADYCREALLVVERDLKEMGMRAAGADSRLGRALDSITKGRDQVELWRRIGAELLAKEISGPQIITAINLLLLSICMRAQQSQQNLEQKPNQGEGTHGLDDPSIHRAAHG
jgi:hypothetical protein